VVKSTIVVLCMLNAATVMAQTANPNPSAPGQQPAPSQTGAISPEDAAKARQEMKDLAKIFDVEPKTNSVQQTTEPSTPQKEKTVADVADRALDMASNLVGSVASTLQKVAPDVWRILIKQQYAKALGELIFPWGMVMFLMVYKKAAYKGWTEYIEALKTSQSANDIWHVRLWTSQIIPTALILYFGTAGLYSLSNTAMYLTNPEYYAVRDLLQLILNPQNPAP
jgi:hypothetical protein